jgi:hypothetical protein
MLIKLFVASVFGLGALIPALALQQPAASVKPSTTVACCAHAQKCCASDGCCCDTCPICGEGWCDLCPECPDDGSCCQSGHSCSAGAACCSMAKK